MAAALADATGRPVRYSPITAAEFVSMMSARGFPRSYGELLAKALCDVEAGRLRIPVSDAVERVTGRRPRGVSEFARDYAM